MAITYGYIRVSTADQNEARQIDAMALAGVDRANVVIDKQSGKDFNRPGWNPFLSPFVFVVGTAFVL